MHVCAYNYSFYMYTNKSGVEITVQVQTCTVHQDITQANNFLCDDQVVF